MNKFKKRMQIYGLVFGMVMIFGCSSVDEEIVVSDKQRKELVENEKNIDGNLGIEEIEEVKEIIEVKEISSKEDCDKLFDKNAENEVFDYSFDNLELFEKVFWLGETKGWCLYRKTENDDQIIGFGYNWRGVTPIYFNQNKYLFHRASCGTACVTIGRINIQDYNDQKLLAVRPSFEISEDYKWLIEYDYKMHENYTHMNYLARAVNLDTFETIDFAKNNCLNADCDFEFDEEVKINFIDEEKGIVKIPFVDKKTGEKNYRTFDMKNNFKEI